MTLALLVACGTLALWLILLALRWVNAQPASERASRRALLAAAGLSGAYVGGGFPIIWAMASNVRDYLEHGSTGFTFAGHLPPGVDEDDLLFYLVVGMAILMGQAVAEAWRAVRRR